jgi:hypothetical protein
VTANSVVTLPLAGRVDPPKRSVDGSGWGS